MPSTSLGKKDQQGKVPIINDPDIIKILQSYINKLTTNFKSNKINTANPGKVVFYSLHTIFYEKTNFIASLLFRTQTFLF